MTFGFLLIVFLIIRHTKILSFFLRTYSLENRVHFEVGMCCWFQRAMITNKLSELSFRQEKTMSSVLRSSVYDTKLLFCFSQAWYVT